MIFSLTELSLAWIEWLKYTVCELEVWDYLRQEMLINPLLRHGLVSLISPLALARSTLPEKSMPLEDMGLTESINHLVISSFAIASSLSIESSPDLRRWIARAKGRLPVIALATMEIVAHSMVRLDRTVWRGTICWGMLPLL